MNARRIRNMIRVCRGAFLASIFAGASLFAQETSIQFKGVFPFISYKKVIDTCMRAYSDLLVLEERTTHHERSDEQIDLLVGRLVRLQNYFNQLVDDYHHEATVSLDDLQYLIRVLEYMEVTAEHLPSDSVPVRLNHCILQLKKMLTDSLPV